MGKAFTDRLGLFRSRQQTCEKKRKANAVVRLFFVGAMGITGAHASEPDPSKSLDAIDAVNSFATMSPNEAMRAGARAYYSGNKQEAVQPLQYAADKGEPMATWKLGRMYSQGDGVQEDDIKAFTYFSKIAHVHGEGNPDGPLAPFVANAIVELGTYFLHGINGSSIQPDPARAKELYAYAATYFGDGEAQYRLAMIHLNEDNRNSKRLAARWLKLSANKGHIEAQARFGELLFFNSSSPKRKAQGLNWLTLASQQASGPKQEWIVALHDKAAAHASENENNRAIAWTNTWLSEAGISVMASN